MAFINKKEEVLQIKLTQFGKTLLSKGKFQPKYYAFFDDDVIYDASSVGIIEEQNNIEDRIKAGIRLDLQHVVTGVETEYLKETKRIEKKERDLYEPIDTAPQNKEKNRLASSALGRATVDSQDAPAFLLHQKGNTPVFESSVTHEIKYTDTSSPQKIPQIYFEPLYKIYVDRKKYKEPVQDFETFLNLMAEEVVFLDGSSLSMKPGTIVLEVLESNSDFTDDNFEFELFEIRETKETEESETVEELIPLQDPENFFEIKKDRNVSNYKEIYKTSKKNIFNRE